jgi:protein-S-isoprenylcysteine O-methyltransferase Ste14
MLAAEYAEFWAAIVGLAAAFIVAVAIESPSEDTNMPGWEAAIGMIAYALPCAVALWSLTELAADAKPPDSDDIWTYGAILLAAQLPLLMGARWVAGRQARRLAEGSGDE